jgi:hypothetical protein
VIPDVLHRQAAATEHIAARAEYLHAPDVGDRFQRSRALGLGRRIAEDQRKLVEQFVPELLLIARAVLSGSLENLVAEILLEAVEDPKAISFHPAHASGGPTPRRISPTDDPRRPQLPAR